MSLTNVDSRVDEGAAFRRKVKRIRRRIMIGFILLGLAACFATTDQPAYYEKTLLIGEDREFLYGHYSTVGDNQLHILEISEGRPTTLDFADRRQRDTPPFFPQKSIGLKALLANLQRKVYIDYAIIDKRSAKESDDSTEQPLITRFKGYAYVSRVPTEEFYLIGFDGITVDQTMVGFDEKVLEKTYHKLEHDAGKPLTPIERPNNGNIFLLMQLKGDRIALRRFDDNNSDFEEIIVGPAREKITEETPIPRDELLPHLQEHAGRFMIDPAVAFLNRTNPENIETKNNLRQQKQTLATNRTVRLAEEEFRKKYPELYPEPEAQVAAPASTERPPAPKPIPLRIENPDGYHLVRDVGIFRYNATPSLFSGYEVELKFIKRLARGKTRLHRLFQVGDIIEKAYWHPDTQQFDSELRTYNIGNRKCDGYSDRGWASQMKHGRYKHTTGRQIDFWEYTGEYPSNRRPARYCVNATINSRTCRIVRCETWSDQTSAPSELVYIVKNYEDALIVFNAVKK